MPAVGTRLTRVALDAARVISTGSIKVYSIMISNATASDAEVVFRNNDDTPILNITVPAQDSEDWSVEWLADNGLKVDSVGDADVVVTVARSFEGA